MSDNMYEFLKKRVDKLERENKDLRALIEEQIYHFMCMFRKEGHHGMHRIIENLKKSLLKDWGTGIISSSLIDEFLDTDNERNINIVDLKHKPIYEILIDKSDYDFSNYGKSVEKTLIKWHRKIDSLDKTTTDQLFLETFRRGLEMYEIYEGSTKRVKEKLEKALKKIKNGDMNDSAIFDFLKGSWDQFFFKLSLFPTPISETMWQVYKKFKTNDKEQLKAIIQELIDECG